MKQDSQIIAQPLKVGAIHFQNVKCDNRLGYFLYIPEQRKSAAEILVCVHGISRNAKEQAEHYRSVADQLGIALIAPLFDKKQFPGYQRLSTKKPGLRADIMLHKVINEVARQLSIPLPELHFIGYSGGAQFAHRFALLHPQRIRTLHLCSAGWYTFPDPTLQFPEGVRGANKWPPIKPNLKGLLEIPTQIIVGTEDRYRDESLNQKKSIDTQQGLNRLERARNWQQALLNARQNLQMNTPIRLTLLEGEGHDFTSNIKQAGMENHVIQFIKQQTNN